MIFGEKIQNNFDSFQMHIFTFQNILAYVSSLRRKKQIFSSGQGVDPPPPSLR